MGAGVVWGGRAMRLSSGEMTMVTGGGQREALPTAWSQIRPTAPVNHGGKLEAQALAKRGGCLDKDIFAVEGGEDDLALVWPGEEGMRVNQRPNGRAWLPRAHRHLPCPHLPKGRLVKLAAEGKVYVLQGVCPRERHGYLMRVAELCCISFVD